MVHEMVNTYIAKKFGSDVGSGFFKVRFEKLEFCTASNNGRQKIRQKICQKISVIKSNSFDWELLTFDDIKKIVNFGILIHVLYCKQKCLDRWVCVCYGY